MQQANVKKKITIGCDPEVFLETGTGVIVNPLLVTGGALQEDNVLAEFNTDPADTFGMFRDNIRTVMGQLENKVSPFKLKVLSSHRFNKEILTKAGKQALEFGCDPDLNAWTNEENNSPSPYTDLRTAGGHVHVGFDVEEDDIESRLDVMKLMDVYLGVPSVLMDGDVDRRSMYGSAGACRLKEYGAEYRVLSNFWLKSDEHIEWVFNQATRAVENKDYLSEILDKWSPKVIQDTINSSDAEMAHEIVTDLQLDLV